MEQSKKERSSLDDYKIDFIINDEGDTYIKVYLRDEEQNHEAGLYLHFWADSIDIKEELLTAIDNVINSKFKIDEVCGSGNGFITVLIEKDLTYFCIEHNLDEGKIKASKDPSRHMPTLVFKEIVLKWLAFLESIGK